MNAQGHIDKLQCVIDDLKEQQLKDNRPVEPAPVVNNGPWKPEHGDKVWFINDQTKVSFVYWRVGNKTETNLARLAIGNCYPTQEKAEQALAHMKTHKKLKDLAFRLNDGVEIDWNSYLQDKYYFNFNCRRNRFISLYTDNIRHANVTYCLDKDFKDKAIEEIGEDALTDYLKWEG